MNSSCFYLENYLVKFFCFYFLWKLQAKLNLISVHFQEKKKVIIFKNSPYLSEQKEDGGFSCYQNNSLCPNILKWLFAVKIKI